MSLVFGDVVHAHVRIVGDNLVARPSGELQMFAAGLVDEHGVTVVDLAGQQHTGQLVAHFGLYQAAQRTSAISRVVTGVGQPFASPSR